MTASSRLRLVLALALLLPWAAFAADRWQPAGPEGGNIVAFAMEPTDPRTLYASARDGGVFKSTDGAATWSLASDGLEGRPALALALAHDPKTAGTLYAGTSQGVFRTTNGGARWTAANGGSSLLADGTIDALVATSSAVYAHVGDVLGREAGIFKSADGGASWSRLDLGRSGIVVTALAADPMNPLVLYAGVKDTGPLFEIGVLRSADGGATWSFSARGLPKGTIRAFAIHPKAPRTVYAAIQGAGVFRSDDGGSRWRSASRGLTNPLVGALAFGPAAETLYAAAQQGSAGTGTGSLFRTADGGRRWRRSDRGLPPDLQTLAADPGGRALYAGSQSAGVFRSTDSGATWALADRGLRAVAADAVVADPLRPAVLFLGTPAFGLLRTADGGASWTTSGMTAKARTPLAIDPEHPATVYALNAAREVLRSRNGGRSWQTIESLQYGVYGFALDPDGPRILYAGGPLHIDRSTDGGDTWTPDLTSPCLSPALFAITPASRVFTGTFSACGPNEIGLGIQERDPGGGWVEVNAGLPLHPSPAGLAADPRQPSTLYAGIDGSLLEPPSNLFGVYQTTDGQTWSLIPALGDNLHSATAFAFPLAEPGVVYTGFRGLGVWVSEDGGETWRAVNDGLPSLSISALAFGAGAPATLYAATPGGLYKLTRSAP